MAKVVPPKPVLNKSKLITAILCLAAAIYVIIKLFVLDKTFTTTDYIIVGTIAIGGMIFNSRSTNTNQKKV